jgi:outer membrane protein OmpU
MAVEHTNGGAENTGKTFSMGNQVTMSGSGELDNGLNVSLSFVLDQADPDPSPFDGHSVTVSSDSLGSLTLAGEGGSNAQTAIDGTAAGDIWDNFDGHGAAGAAAEIYRGAGATGVNSFYYTLPTLMDGVSASISYLPSAGSTLSSTAWNVQYTGVEGLTVKYGSGEGNTIGTDEDIETLYASYAYGPVTVSYSNTEYDTSASASTSTGDSDHSSMAVSYTVSDELSVTYGQETVESDDTTGTEDAEFKSISASYTAGGMTISASMQDAENIDGSTTATKDQERWALSASFAF